MTDTRPFRLALALAVAAAGGAAAAQTAQTAPQSAASAAPADREISRGDRRFLEEAAAGGMAEVALGNMARERGGSAPVREFGERMVADHGRANEELTRLAAARGVGTPTDSDRRHRRTMERLGQQQGADFDRSFAEAMVDDHERTVKLFEAQSRRGEDAEIKAFATRTLPTLREHLHAARALRDSVKAAR